jgi:hypothetical protein
MDLRVGGEIVPFARDIQTLRNDSSRIDVPMLGLCRALGME